jgi:L-alanine-DL-glutamate epimerase-like enolase superfamily enzyme
MGKRAGHDGRIAAVEAIPFTIPMARPLAHATGVLSSAEHVLIRITTADGIVGVAEAIPRLAIYGETTPSILHFVKTAGSEAAIGLGLSESARLAYRLRNVVGNDTARGALELAMFDALGKSLNLSCHQLLGGFAESVRVTAMLGADGEEVVAGEALGMREMYGINSFKLKGGRDLRRDIAITERMRSDHPDADIYVDFNHAYTLPDALRYCRATRDLDLLCLEEPLPGSEVSARAVLARRSDVPIMGDETCRSPREVTTEVVDGRCGIVSIKVVRGGLSGSLRIREFCASYGVPVLVGSQGDSGIGTFVSAAFAAAAPSTSVFPAELNWFLSLEGDLLEEPPQIKGGSLAVPAGPGFGYRVDPDRLRHYASGHLQCRLW